VDATHNGTQEEVPSVVVTAAGGNDVVGNTQPTSPNSNSFAIDTKRPTVVSSNRLLPLASTPTKVTSVTFQVIFSENVTNVGVDASDFSVATSGTATITAKRATSVDAKTYNVTLTGVSGDGTLRLDILNTATINDATTNDYTANFNTGEIFTIDNTAPVVAVYFFHVDWCPHCIKAQPEWDSFQKQYDNKEMGGYLVRCYDIDCTEDNGDAVIQFDPNDETSTGIKPTSIKISELIQKYKIESYPTIKLTKDDLVVDFDAKVTQANLVQFVSSV
jgi:thiol-disulfide isomerase/thioredoxin